MTEANRTAVRRITIEYENRQETKPLEVCRALTEMGIMALDNTWSSNGEFDADHFADREVKEIKYEVILLADPSKVWITEYFSDTEALTAAMPDTFDVRKVVSVKKAPPRWVGGPNQYILAKWCDLSEEYEDGFEITTKSGANISARGCTNKGRLTIEIIGPSDSLDTQSVEEAVGFLTHRWDSVFRSFGFSGSTFDCEVNLSYNKVVACDVSWLAKQMPREDDEE